MKLTQEIVGGTTPDDIVARMILELLKLCWEDRMKILGSFCSYCGEYQSDGKPCQCFNDE